MNSDKKKLIVVGAIFIIFAILAGWYFYSYSQKEPEAKRPLTKEERMKILESLKVPTEEELPREERMKILESLKVPTEEELPREERMRILESLTP